MIPNPRDTSLLKRFRDNRLNHENYFKEELLLGQAFRDRWNLTTEREREGGMKGDQ